MARGIASKAPLAIQAVKEQLRILEDLQPMPVQAMEQIAELRRQACESADFSEGLAAFSEDGHRRLKANEQGVCQSE